MTNETKKQSKAPQTKSETKVAVKKNTEATIKKLPLKGSGGAEEGCY